MAESNSNAELNVSSQGQCRSSDFSNLESKEFDDTESMSESSSHASSSSLLSRLRSPMPSDLSQKRKVAQNLENNGW